MIQKYDCYGDGEMMAVKQGRGNWIRYSDHLAEVERAVEITFRLTRKECWCEESDCVPCIKKRVMEELKK